MDPREFFRGFFGIPQNEEGKPPRGFGEQDVIIIPPNHDNDLSDLNRVLEQQMDHIMRNFGLGAPMGPQMGPPMGPHGPSSPHEHDPRGFMLAPGFEPPKAPGDVAEDKEITLAEIDKERHDHEHHHHHHHPPPHGGHPHHHHGHPPPHGGFASPFDGFHGFFFGGIPGMGRDVFPGLMPPPGGDPHRLPPMLQDPDVHSEFPLENDPQQNESRSYFSFRSQRSVTLPDGSTETRETKRDSSGQTETVTRISPTGEVTREVIKGPQQGFLEGQRAKEGLREEVGVWGKNTTQSLFDRFFGSKE